MSSTKHVRRDQERRARRERLFRESRPHIRPIEPKDINWVWVAHKLNGNGSEEDEMGYKKAMAQYLSQYDVHLILEDHNPRFRSKRGPIGMFIGAFNGWTFEPHVEWFPWASKRNKLRGVVAFLTTMRSNRDVGITVIHSAAKHAQFFQRLRRYVPIMECGTIRFGRPNGPDLLFAVRGKMKGQHNGIPGRLFGV